MKCKKLIVNIIAKIYKNHKNINKFFKILDKNITIPLKFIPKKVAGKKVLIPCYVSKKKRIKYSIKIILKSLKKRTEKKLFDKVYNEFLDIYFNKGLSIKNKTIICKDILNNSLNLRFLK